jgi:hypothetical protein
MCRAYRAMLVLSVTGACALPAKTVGALCSLEPVSPSCAELPALANTPVIDGTLECGVQVQTTPMEWSLKTPAPADFAVTWATAYSQNGLYFYIDVVKSSIFVAPNYKASPWCGDAVHLFIDGDGRFDSAPAYDADTRQIICTAPLEGEPQSSQCMRFNKRAIEGMENAKQFSSGQLVSFRTASGYRFEGFVTALELGTPSWTLQAGVPVAFALSVDFGGRFTTPPDAQCPGRNGEFNLKVATTPNANGERTPHVNTNAFCTPTLQPARALNWD